MALGVHVGDLSQLLPPKIRVKYLYTMFAIAAILKMGQLQKMISCRYVSNNYFMNVFIKL